MHKITSTFFFLLFCVSLTAQTFTDQTLKLSKQGFHSGVPMGIADMNGDGLDDLVRLDNTNHLWVDFQVSGADTLFSNDYGLLPFNSQSWSMAIADTDNDGLNEILTGGSYDNVKIMRFDSSVMTYVPEPLPGSTIFLQGSNLADINNDGFIDVFACHDDAASVIWMNNGDGSFTRDYNKIDLTTATPSDNSGNYGSVWTDFDNDGDIDLYIAKCRQGVNDPRDARRINVLYVNDGSNQYEEKAAEFGLKIGDQSWTAEFQDIDNDGDMDAFITNHDSPSMLLENDGSGHFTDITENSGIQIDGLPIQGIMKDFDNDGFVDLLISGTISYYFKNNGNKTFTVVSNAFGQEYFESFAVGDLDDNGFLDVYTGYAEVFNNPTFVDDVLWMNEGNDNNYLKVKLEGTASNRPGVGARIEIFGPFGIQVREVRAGESYGISNSLVQHFGLGQQTTVDRVVVRWPSGNINVVYNPGVNQQLVIGEEVCNLNLNPEITINGETIICNGESVELVASSAPFYLWSNGAATQNITVTESGLYTVYVGETNDCLEKSDGVLIIVSPDETPTISVAGETEFCEGGSVVLTASDSQTFNWSNGGNTQSIEVGETGNYQVSIEGLCGTFTSEAVVVSVTPGPAAPQAEDVNIPVAGPVSLMASGSLPRWYDLPSGGQLLEEGNTFDIPFIQNDTTFYVEDVNLSGGLISFTGMTEHAGGSQYSGDQFNGGLLFDCTETFSLLSVKVVTDTEGERIFEIIEENTMNVVHSKLVNIPIGESRVVLDFEIQPGFYFFTTNGQKNETELGFASPRLQRSNSGAEFPYEVEDWLRITGNSFGGDRFYYFYDWEVKAPFLECPGERVAVGVTVGTVSIRDIDQSPQIQLYPNPGSGIFSLDMRFENPQKLKIRVMDSQGHLVHKDHLTTPSGDFSRLINLEGFPKGLYWLQLSTTSDSYYGKLLIQ